MNKSNYYYDDNNSNNDGDSSNGSDSGNNSDNGTDNDSNKRLIDNEEKREIYQEVIDNALDQIPT